MNGTPITMQLLKKLFISLVMVSLPILSFAQEQQDKRQVDWAGFNRYAEANKQVTTAPQAVFMGDSITEFWGLMRPAFFADNGFVCRGISAQTVEQMLARFQADVVDLHPRAVVILAGINNIAGNNGKIAFENIVGCLKSMCEIARANGIIPILCSLTPCHRFFWNQEAKPAQDVIRLNALLKEYAAGAGVEYVDFHGRMALPGGEISQEDSMDGCHPTVAGYQKMETILLPETVRILNR